MNEVDYVVWCETAEIVRESFCDGCKGAEYGLPCYVENDCKDFQEAVAKQLEEWGME